MNADERVRLDRERDALTVLDRRMSEAERKRYRELNRLLAADDRRRDGRTP